MNKRVVFRRHAQSKEGGIIAEHNGQECEVVYDGLNPGMPMSLVRFDDGFTLAVFPDEMIQVEDVHDDIAIQQDRPAE